MKKQNALAAGTSETEKVDEFMASLDYPLKDVVTHLRKFILDVDKQIVEGIFWNAPTFYYSGTIEPFDPKEYKRYIVGFNLFRKDAVRLIFLRGADVKDPGGLLEGDYKDGRRLAQFSSIEEVKRQEKALADIIRQLLVQVKG